MTSRVVTVSSDTVVPQAEEIMRAHRFARLPIVDSGKLVGLLTKDRVLRAAPSSATSLSVWELTYLLSKMTVGEIMQRNVVTVSPDATIEAAVTLAQQRRVGCLPVVEGGTLVGIVTTNDFFFKVLNPILGIGAGGTRLIVSECPDVGCLKGVLDVLDGHKAEVTAMMYLLLPTKEKRDLVLHIAQELDVASGVMKDLNAAGYSVEIRGR